MICLTTQPNPTHLNQPFAATVLCRNDSDDAVLGFLSSEFTSDIKHAIAENPTLHANIRAYLLQASIIADRIFFQIPAIVFLAIKYMKNLCSYPAKNPDYAETRLLSY